jgi:hypothetical protein
MQCFVAVSEQPVERLMGAAFWWEVESPEAQRAVEFRWQLLPVLAGTDSEQAFLLALAACVTAAGYDLLRSEPLPDGAHAQQLPACGFEFAYQQAAYLGTWENWLQRTQHLLARLSSPQSTAGLSVRRPELSDTDALIALAAQRYNLLAAPVIQADLQAPATATAFDDRYSALLFQSDRLIGACLVKCHERHVKIPVLVVDASDKKTQGLGSALLFDHCQRSLAQQDLREVLFLTNPELSPSMPRLAHRFAARALGSSTAWRLRLGAGSAVRDSA